jgi:hypothetical protein
LHCRHCLGRAWRQGEGREGANLMIPALTTYLNGPNAVSGDQLNTFVQTPQTANQLRQLTGLTGMAVMLQGIVSAGDGLGGFFYWNGAATAADDNRDTLVPVGTVPGAWLRISEDGGVTSVLGNTGAVTLAQLLAGGVAPNTYLSPLTGGVSRSLNAKLTDVVSVKDFGATGNGSTDDTATVQAAANALIGGGELYFPPGNYLLSNGIGIHSGTLVRGTGKSSVLKASAAQVSSTTNFADNALLVNVGGAFNGGATVTSIDISVENLAFDGTLAPTRGSFHAVRFGQVQRVRVTNSYCINAGDFTAFLGCNDTVCRDNFSSGITNAGHDHWAGPSNALVDGCTVYCDPSAGLYGILFTASDTDDTVAEQAGNFRCTNNTIMNAPGAAIWCNVLTTRAGSDVFFCNISGNCINSGAVSSVGAGIKISGPGSGHIVRGNIFTAVNGGSTIVVGADPGTAVPSGVSITDNIAISCTVSSGNVAYINCAGNEPFISNNVFLGGTASNLVWVSGAQPVVINNYGVGSPSGQTVSTSGATNAIVMGVDNAANRIFVIGFAPDSIAGIVGTTTSNNCNAGSIGEYISASIGSGSPTGVTSSGVPQNVISISLSAGDWDVRGNIGFIAAASTTIDGFVVGISTTSAAFVTPPSNGAYQAFVLPFTTGAANAFSTGTARISLSSTTTIYLVAQANYNVSTMSVYGFIGARRVR